MKQYDIYYCQDCTHVFEVAHSADREWDGFCWHCESSNIRLDRANVDYDYVDRAIADIRTENVI